ncbi:hypothetical protein GCM10027579_05390 [Calidifontibacter terrae]
MRHCGLIIAMPANFVWRGSVSAVSEDMTSASDSAEHEPTLIDPHALQNCLDVLALVKDLPPEHPQAEQVRHATARIYKTWKVNRRNLKQAAIVANDDAVTAATATGAPTRIDDETQGLPLVSYAAGALAGRLIKPRAADRWPGEDRDVHRAAAAARRCTHHDHDPLPERRDPPVQGHGGQRRLDPPAAHRRYRSP